MGFSRLHRQGEAPPCPQCGKPNSAIVSSTQWKHKFKCCSEECGVNFFNNPLRVQTEIFELQAQQDVIKQKLANKQVEFDRLKNTAKLLVCRDLHKKLKQGS